MLLKADVHLHPRAGERFIAYDARALIDREARAGYRVLSITNHDTVTFAPSFDPAFTLSEARWKGERP